MRELIKKFPQFALTGAPLQQEHIQWLFDTTDSFVDRIRPFCQQKDLEFTHVVSGDYKGATDGIDIKATKTAFEALLRLVKIPLPEGTREQYMTTLQDVLYEQTLIYPEDGPEDTRQNNGQLMGSNLSFPILCVINLIGYWMTMEEYTGLTFEPMELPVLVNGDDILFRTPQPRPDDPESFYETWKRNITLLGFELSVGKNYVHDSVFTVNSECWVVKTRQGIRSFTRVRHLDVGLLVNNNAAARLENRTLPLGDRMNRVLEGAWSRKRAWDRLKHYYRDELKAWMQVGRHTTFNVCSAVELGGLGINPEGLDVKFTNFQRRLAAFQRKRLMSMTNYDQLSELDQIALGCCSEGASLSYEVPVPGRQIQWISAEKREEDELQIRKDVRSLPVLSREMPINRQMWIKKYSTQTLKKFRKALKDGVINLDDTPYEFGLKPARISRETLMSSLGDTISMEARDSITEPQDDWGYLENLEFSL
jgi:hypothetical protein